MPEDPLTGPRWPWKRRSGDAGQPAPATAVPATLTAPAIAEAAVILGSLIFGIEPGDPDPDVPPAEIAYALAGIAAAILEDRFPGDKGASYVAALGALAASTAGSEPEST